MQLIVERVVTAGADWRGKPDMVHAAASVSSAVPAVGCLEWGSPRREPVARRPLLPERATFVLSFVGSLVAWAGGARVAEAVLPEAAALVASIVVGLVALVGIPVLLGRPAAAVILLIAAGGFAILVGFISQFDDLGLGRALAIYVPATAVLVALVWSLKRFLLPGQRLGDRV